MKYVFSFLIALLLSPAAFSQKGKEYFLVDSVNYDSLPAGDRLTLDSLLPLYHSAGHDTTRLKILVDLGENINTEWLWPKYADLLYQKGEQILKNPNSLTPKVLRSIKSSYAMALQDKGYFEENYNGNIPASLDYYYKCQKIQEEIADKKNLAMTLNNIGISLHSQGNIGKSLEYYMRSVKIQEELNDKLGMAYGLNNIASTYIEQGDTAKAIEYQKKSMALREGAGDKHGLAISLSNLAAIYNNKGDREKALGYFTRCVKLWEELGEKQGLAFCVRYMGVIYQRKAEQLKREGKVVPDSLLKRSEEFMFRSLQLYQGVGDKRGTSLILALIGDHFVYLGDITKALDYALRSVSISKEIGYPQNLQTSYLLLYKIYRIQGRWNDALAMHELSTQMHDSIFSADIKKSILQKEMRYEYEKKEALAEAEHRKELLIAEEAKKRQQVFSYLIGLGLVMVLLFSLFIFYRLRIARKQKLVIEEQKVIVEQKNKHITDSINYAKRIQDSILPSGEELEKCFSDHFVFFRPRDVVSGDFYWVSSQNDKIVLAIADCTGHGVPGACMSLIGHTLLNEIVNENKITDPSEILKHLNTGIIHALHQDSGSLQDDGMDIGICTFEKKSRALSFAGANRSCILTENGKLKELKGDLFSIGGASEKKEISFSNIHITAGAGSSIFMFTDGFSDQPGGEKKKRFQERNLVELLLSNSSKPMKEQNKDLQRTIEAWQGTRNQLDDMLVIGIKI